MFTYVCVYCRFLYFYMLLTFRISLEAQLAKVLVRLFFDFLPLLIKYVIASFSTTEASCWPKHETKSLYYNYKG